MAVTSLWGFGGVRFASNQTYSDAVEFPYAKGTLSFVPVFLKRENINRKLIYKLKGYRVSCSIELTNVLADDYAKFQSLFGIINNLGESGTITINPAYESTAELFLAYDMILDSDISLKQIHWTECAQTLKLEFIKPELEQNIPTITNDSQIFTRVTDAGDTLVTDAGDTRIVENN